MRHSVLLLLLLGVPLLMGAGSDTSGSGSSRYERYFKNGLEAEEDKDYEKAVKWYKRALEEKPNDPDALNNLGFSLRKIGWGYMSEADKAYRMALDADADHEEALEYQGELFLWQGKLVQANENLQRLKKLRSDEAGELEAKLNAVLAEAKKLL